MLNINKEPAGDGAVVLKLEGDATIENAEQLHKVMLETLQEVEHLLIDCEQVTNCDFYVLQLFCSSHRTAIKWGKEFTFYGAPSSAVVDSVSSMGFSRTAPGNICPADTNCLWIDK